MASQIARVTAQAAQKSVKPVLSRSAEEARLRVLGLYRAWYRTIPYIVMHYDVCITPEQGKAKLREIFKSNVAPNDIRAIDMLVVKGQMELQEIVNKWTSKGMIMRFFAHVPTKKETDFLTKFLAGKD